MKKILICEDDPNVAAVVGRILDVSGYEAIVTKLGSEALDELYHKNRIDLLITDLILPLPISGIQLIDRALALNPSLPVILMTGYAHNEPALQSERLWNVAVLNKPFSKVKLQETVEALLTPSERRTQLG